MTQVTIMGARGFVGRHLKEELLKRGIVCSCPERDQEAAIGKNLGHVVYAIGLTADFRSRPFDTVEAHVCKLARVLSQCTMESFLYLSSGRVYGWGKNASTQEDASLSVNPLDPSDLYNLSKAMGESLCLASPHKVRIARLSNVYGADVDSVNFLSDVIREALVAGKIVLRTSLDSAKDYISIRQAVDIIIRIMLEGRQSIYNVASGFNTTHREIVEKVSQLTGCSVELVPDAPLVAFPPISTERIDAEFGLAKRPKVADDMAELVGYYAIKHGENI